MERKLLLKIVEEREGLEKENKKIIAYLCDKDPKRLIYFLL